MVSEEIKLLNIAENKNKVEITLEINRQKRKFQIEVIYNHGLFAVEFPTNLRDVLNNFPNTVSQNILTEVKSFYFSAVKQAA